MPEYKSNAKSVLGSLIKKLQGIDTKVMDNITRTIAAGLIPSNMDRIHEQGKAVDGSDIGHYTDGAYKKKRQKRQKRIDKVNLDFSGKLHKEFSFAPVAPKTIGVGFITSYGANLSEVLEEKYNKKIWGVTQEDERVAEEIAKNKVNQYMNG
jgi:hypothetical protein